MCSAPLAISASTKSAGSNSACGSSAGSAAAAGASSALPSAAAQVPSASAAAFGASLAAEACSLAPAQLDRTRCTDMQSEFHRSLLKVKILRYACQRTRLQRQPTGSATVQRCAPPYLGAGHTHSQAFKRQQTCTGLHKREEPFKLQKAGLA